MENASVCLCFYSYRLRNSHECKIQPYRLTQINFLAFFLCFSILICFLFINPYFVTTATRTLTTAMNVKQSTGTLNQVVSEKLNAIHSEKSQVMAQNETDIKGNIFVNDGSRFCVYSCRCQNNL